MVLVHSAAAQEQRVVIHCYICGYCIIVTINDEMQDHDVVSQGWMNAGQCSKKSAW